MKIRKLKLVNFKKFKDNEFLFNDDVNILVGDNNSGKSSILEAIEIVLNYSYRGKPLYNAILSDIMNVESINRYIDSDKNIEDLPTITIEAFIDGLPDYRGTINKDRVDTQGISFTFSFDFDLTTTYNDFIKTNKDNITSIPLEFYKIEWMTFANEKIRQINKPFKSLFIDPTRLHPTYGKNQYIYNVLTSALSREEQAVLGIKYRQLKESFNIDSNVTNINDNLDSNNEISDKTIKIVADISGGTNLESNLQLALDGVTLPYIGKGEQHKVQIKLALQNKSNTVDVLLIEEPENHLSHMNLTSLVSFIEKKLSNKQLFISTHSSYVMNKLSIDKLCLLANGYKQLNNIDCGTVKKLKRLPGYDTLRAVLSSKVILVEGPSDELILKKYYYQINDKLPEEDGIDIIVVRGIGFNNYLEIIKHTGVHTRVMKDNDGNYDKNVKKYIDEYKGYDFIKIYSSEENEQYSLEPLLIETNSDNEELLDKYAKISLSARTYKEFEKEINLLEKISFLKNWYKDEGGAGKKKVDTAMRIFESNEKIKYPTFFESIFDYE
ncbi:AAA family ATPase [Xenorhabdus bovienii]|uniref:ATP-dependent nuclease n=1 Tax=Xenorhabdus bovienii TaxID=40576 RepID=UPI00237C8013|nr:AAA family ATPase [Xenorhabdus bovienii]MDE1485737.1 AAA family ATPase [Xenorhabdus bovienii]MDE1495076.1 AAA family ATPase [Xenorhabdus bovienii]MDE9435673.1 AAA family ATPase [Xenorhabdus bovienii]MDE9473128.1 AAA family ATPase [Xenorhabdus bovienii]MDE9476541.1 AAA family ATPase [Xenorhabdus bovienii]